eukprot:CAMPEP_0202962778 /NCGR_PEP_ID=MMETSP1396-20130829/6839_1 /ASSEMBLY_ACC=CAM_ASM_000872 /TAXON_ID= /ORGANISM="Pseudokeronopsis sp., Strain Brazil" /LENGTH=128 /DNA_ID=CAMNT_0049683543 /DNA_START=135 /DNA_END=521 /DNA_ORIENTATION=+
MDNPFMICYYKGYEIKHQLPEIKDGTLKNIPLNYQESKDFISLLESVEKKCKQRGNKALENILVSFFASIGKYMCYAELVQFNERVLGLTNAELYRYLLEKKPIEEEHKSEVLERIVSSKAAQSFRLD